MSAEVEIISTDAIIRFGTENLIRQDIAKSPQIISRFVCFEPRQDEVSVAVESGKHYPIDAKIGKEF
ncbi:MAG: hypothetical protein ACPGQV_15610 [Alphaproteobacteria bacterium]